MQPKQDLAGGQTLSSGVVGQQGPNYIYSIQGRVTRSFMAAFQPIASIEVFNEHWNASEHKYFAFILKH